MQDGFSAPPPFLMASSNNFNFGSVKIFHDQVLGSGSYGKVCKAKYGQLPCAAKLLHDTMFETGDPGIFKFAERFEQECQFLSMIKHPNIVQYLGTFRHPKTYRLALLMELMDESLTKLLERSTGALHYHVQLNICHDVALALSCLHFNTIIHRDLSSNNVLLIGEGNRAKVTDFGMSKLMDMNPRMTPLTTCPGSQVYMPPEALTTPPHYSSKLDCFSHGVLTIQILTRNFPNPGDAHQSVQDPNYPTGQILIHIPETERRKEDIGLVEPHHPLLPLALRCLHNTAAERPSADDVCERLATLKREERYTHSVEQVRDQISQVQIIQKQLAQNDEMAQQERIAREQETRDHASLVQNLQRQLAQKDQILEQERTSHQREITVHKNELTLKNVQIQKLTAQKNELLHDKEVQLQQLQKERDNHVAQLKRERDEHEKEQEESRKLFEQIFNEHYESLQEKKEDKKEEKKEVTVASPATGVAMIPAPSEWTIGAPTPVKSSLGRGRTLVDRNIVYCSYDYDVYSFTMLGSKWTKPPSCPHKWFAMAVIHNKLTAIGGWSSESSKTNILLSLTTATSWTEVLPPMPTIRTNPAAVSTGTHLVVAGGTLQQTVEVFDTHTLQWLVASSLPAVVTFPQMTLCAGHIYLSDHAAMFSCPVDELVKSCKPAPTSNSDSRSMWTRLRKSFKNNLTIDRCEWIRLADIPVKHAASILAERGKVLAIGGANDEASEDPTSAIHCYDLATNSWSVIGELPVPLSSVLAAILPSGELIVVGGIIWKQQQSQVTYITQLEWLPDHKQ